MKPTALAAACLGLALLSFFRYPGHTWLQQDTQIYVPILEQQSDPSMLRNDILAQQPQVNFTLYDEVTRTLRALTGTGFREVLGAQQVVTRALGIWGFILLAEALGLSAGPAFLVAAICALGAFITGPQVLSFEYEPTPRAFAVPLTFCAMGLAAQRRYWASGVAAAAAFLYHPPTALPFWALFLVLAAWPAKASLMRQRLRGVLPMVLAAALLLLAAHGSGQVFFGRLSPLQEQLQRMRTAYSWISTWHTAWIVHYCVLSALAVLAFTRVRRAASLELEVFLLGMPLVGMLSMPVSYLLLERLKWALMPELQPMRTLLFVTVSAQALSAVAGVRAVQERRRAEAVAWFALAYLVPQQPVFVEGLTWRPILLAVLLASVALAAVRWPVLGLAAFFAFPVAYPALHTPEVAGLAAWARTATPRDAVFLFPDAGHGLDPGIFRAEALRAVFVDWKGGGQVNYGEQFAREWWTRWRLAMTAPIDLSKYAALGVTYVVVKPEHRLPRAPIYQNARYLAYVVNPTP